MRELANDQSNDQRIAVYGLAIFVCAFLGPFGTSEDLNFWDRLAFWTIVVTTAGIAIEACIVATLESKWLSRTPEVLQIFIGACLGAVPGTSFVIGTNRLFRPEHLDDRNFGLLWLQVVIMALLISGLRYLIWARMEKPARGMPDGETPEPEAKIKPIKLPRLLARLPDRFREGQIISMSMQDHYVEITTTLGSDVILMRLKDAIELLDGVPGARTHRSHWAARNHSVELKKVSRRHELTLKDGRVLPVSNRYLEQVEEMLEQKKGRSQPAPSRT